MKKILLSCVMLFAAAASQAAVGDDLTSKYLKNADFSQGTPIDGGICTYDKDMEANGTVYFGQQAVEGWEAFSLSTNTYEAPGLGDASPNRAASAIFAHNDEVELEDDNIFLGGAGYLAPFTNPNEEEAGTFLGLVAVWGGTAQYTQAVTLPAGCYTITFTSYNSAGTGAISTNLCGFIAENGKAYTCENKTFDVATWFDQEVTFILDEETTGVISVGYVGPAGSGSMPHLFIDNVKIVEGDPQPIIQAQVDALKEDLLPLLEAGDELGVSTDAGWAVYNNDNATIAEVEAAIAAQKEINEKGMTDLTDFFINNAHFAEGTPVDCGVCTYDYDMPVNEVSRYGMQPIEKWIASSPSDNVQKMANSGDTGNNNILNSRASGLFAVGSDETIWLGSKGDVAPATKADGSTEGNVFGFISVWSGTAYYSQHVTLPAGNYTITIPTYNERGTGAINKNMCGFIADSGEEYLAETKTFPVGKWSNETIKFSLDEETPGLITIGYVAANAGSGSMPHLFVDEFELKYNGLLDVTPSLLALQGAVRTAEEYTSGDIVFDSTILKRLTAVAAEGQALVTAGSTDDDANIAAATALNNVIAEAKASATVYEKFAAFVEGKLSNIIDKYTEGDLADLASELSDERDSYYDVLGDGSKTSDELNAIMNGLDARVKETVKAALDAAATDGAEHSLDVSALFTNIDYANSNVDGWKNETGTTAFLSRVQTAEVWNQSNFNVYQTLGDMPAGVYEIKTNGFYRTAANVDNYAAWEAEEVAGKAYLYAGANKVLFHNVAELAGEKDAWHTAGADDADAEIATLFVPNSNDNAHVAFYDEKLCENTVTTALLETGDLTIGVKGQELEGNAWVVWGAFSVIYKGVDENVTLAVLNEEIDALIEEATLLAEDPIISTVDKSLKGLEDAIDGGDDAKNSSTLEDKTDAIATLKAAIAYANESTPLINKIFELFNLYSELLSNSDIDSDDDTLSNLLDNEIGNPEDGAKSNEQIQTWIEEIPAAWTKFVCGQSEMKTASEAAPVDVTSVILNAGFEGVTSETAHNEFWSITKDGGSEGYQFGIYEFYNNNSFDLHQTLTNLVPGYYRVKVQGFYRAGDNPTNATTLAETPDSINQVQFYANESAANFKNVLDLEDVEDAGYVAGTGFGVGSEPVVSWKGNEEFMVPNNREALAAYFEAGLYWNQIDCKVAEDGVLTFGIRKEANVTNDWCPYDNFELYYLGTTAPTAVESIAAEASLNETIFDLQGRKVSKAQKGLYIKSGKVMLVK